MPLDSRKYVFNSEKEMADRRNIYLCQVNHRFGRNVFLPNSVGMLQAYCQSIEKIRNNFNFKGFIFLREDPALVVERMENPKVVGFSCYIWNWEYNKYLAREVKAKYPDCLVILGGPQVPNDSNSFFMAHPFSDILVHYEGEIVFSEILLESLEPTPDFKKISSLSVKEGIAGTVKTPPRNLSSELSHLVSPYLAGVFDDLMKEPYDFHASQETHRGCPYSCTFCVWGSATMSKVRAIDDAILEEEYEWFGRNKIDLLYNCDANYGILKRDYDLTVKMTKTKEKFGYPRKFRASFAKNSNMKIFEIAKILEENGMSKGVTLSFQSVDPHALELIRRSNIKVDNFSGLMRIYRNEGIPTFTEMILALPGETYKTFVDGIAKLIAAGQHDSLHIYNCTVLVNSEMADPEYKKKHGIVSVRVPILLGHSSPQEDDIVEYEDIIIQTKAMPGKDWRRTVLFAWAVQCFHCMSLTQMLAVFFFTEWNVSYSAFYEKLLEFARKNPEIGMGKEYRIVTETLDRVEKGGSWDYYDSRFGNIIWPLEEGSFLSLIADKEAFYNEIEGFIHGYLVELDIDISSDLFKDLLAYQSGMIVGPDSPKAFRLDLTHNLHDYFQKAYVGEKIPLDRIENSLQVKADVYYENDLETYAREVVWYGRKGGMFRHSNVTEIFGVKESLPT